MTHRPLAAFFAKALITSSLPLLALVGRADEARGELSEIQFETALAQLGSDDFGTRQKAQKKLVQFATADRETVLGKSLDTYLESADPEVRYRLRAAMLSIIAGGMRPEGFIGIRMMDAPMRILNGGNIEQERAVQVLTVLPETAAEKAGLRPGDRIVKLDGKPFGEKLPAYIELSEYVRSKTDGENLKIAIKRGVQSLEFDLELGARPEGIDDGRKERLFSDWMESQLDARGLAKTESKEAVESAPTTEAITPPSPRIRIPLPEPEPFPGNFRVIPRD